MRRSDFTRISVIEIKVDGEDAHKNRVLYKVFENLNSAGTPLKNQELRNEVYQYMLKKITEKIEDNKIIHQERMVIFLI